MQVGSVVNEKSVNLTTSLRPIRAKLADMQASFRIYERVAVLSPHGGRPLICLRLDDLLSSRRFTLVKNEVKLEG